MQVVADHKGVLQGLQDEGGGLDEEEIKERNCLEMEYFILRTALVSCTDIFDNYNMGVGHADSFHCKGLG